jgi:hypothetical protein
VTPTHPAITEADVAPFRKEKLTVAIPGGDPESRGEPPEAVPADVHAGEPSRPARSRGTAAQAIAALILVTGLWVAISPRFLAARGGGTDTASEVIIGLVIAGVGALALVNRHGLVGVQLTSLVLGVWVVLISSFLLDVRASIAAPWFWSNTWSGAVLAMLALTQLAIRRPGTQ